MLLELADKYDADAPADSLEPLVPSSLIEAFRATLSAPAVDPSLKAYSLTLPDFSTLSQAGVTVGVTVIVTVAWPSVWPW